MFLDILRYFVVLVLFENVVVLVELLKILKLILYVFVRLKGLKKKNVDYICKVFNDDMFMVVCILKKKFEVL